MENEIQEEVRAEQPNRLHQVTPLSKYLAMALFILLPFLAGYIGYVSAPEKVVEVEKSVEVEKVAEVPVKVNHDESEVGVIFDRPEKWKLYVLPTKEGDETIEYEQKINEIILLDNQIAYLHEDGFDPTQVRIKKYKQSAEATIKELTNQNSSTEQITLGGLVATKIVTPSGNNTCSTISYVHIVDEDTSVGVDVSGVCPSHSDGYDELKISVAESVKVK